MMKRAVGFALMLAGLLCLGVLLPQASAESDNSARVVRLSLVDGDVQVTTDDGTENAILNMPVVQGMEFRTGSNGYAELEFERSSAVRVAPRSVIRLSELSRRPDGDPYSVIDIDRGLVYFNLFKKEAETFRVNARGQYIRIPKAAHFRVNIDNGVAEIAVFKGEVEVAGLDRTIKVKKNESLRLDGGFELAKNIPAFAEDSWDAERMNYRETYASSYRSSGYSGYSSAYSYGLSDLSYYGGYNYAPGYGWFWQPYGVGYGWDPFADGAWMWYPGWGWTWVSTYPWGWMPYRYGHWGWLPSYGWCWYPDHTWANWRPVPNVQTPPGSKLVGPRPPSTPPPKGRRVIYANAGTPTNPVVTSPGGHPSIRPVGSDSDRPRGMPLSQGPGGVTVGQGHKPKGVVTTPGGPTPSNPTSNPPSKKKGVVTTQGGPSTNTDRPVRTKPTPQPKPSTPPRTYQSPPAHNSGGSSGGRSSGGGGGSSHSGGGSSGGGSSHSGGGSSGGGHSGGGSSSGGGHSGGGSSSGGSSHSGGSKTH